MWNALFAQTSPRKPTAAAPCSTCLVPGQNLYTSNIICIQRLHYIGKRSHSAEGCTFMSTNSASRLPESDRLKLEIEEVQTVRRCHEVSPCTGTTFRDWARLYVSLQCKVQLILSFSSSIPLSLKYLIAILQAHVAHFQLRMHFIRSFT